jgi:hypothetical protein
MRARLLRRLAPALVAALAAAACASPAQAYRLDGIPWPGRPATITYWNGTGYAAQVAQAAQAWNRSGARVRFVRAPRRRAALRIVYDPRSTFGSAELAHGSASVGYQPRNRIALSRGARGVGAVGVIAHELGHVLGLIHEDRRCATMNSATWSRCTLPPSCSILQPDDIRGAVARYGGAARRPAPELCPPAPAGLTVDRAPDSGRILAAITVSPAAGVVGAVEQHAVGRCPDSAGGILRGQLAAPGASFVVDVTPSGPFVGLAGGMLCVRAWSFDDTGRVSAAALTRQIALPPAAAPAG